MRMVKAIERYFPPHLFYFFTIPHTSLCYQKADKGIQTCLIVEDPAKAVRHVGLEK